MAAAPVWAAAAIAVLAVTGCTNENSGDPSTAARQPRQCFNARDARNFRPAGNNAVNVRVGRDTYRIDTIGVCSDLNWTNRMALVTSGTSTVCVGSGLGTTIVTNGPAGRQRCQVRQITALTPEQVQALPANQRP